MKYSERLKSLRLWACVSLMLTLGLPASQGADRSSSSQDSMEKERAAKLRMFRWEKDSNPYSSESAGRKKKSRKIKAEKEREGKPRIFRRDKEFKKHRVDSAGKRKAKGGKKKKARMFRWEKDR